MTSAGAGPADDRRLLERIRRGDTEGAAELFERYGPALLRFSDRLLSDRATAEEVTQEVFVKVISRAHQYDGRAEVILQEFRQLGGSGSHIPPLPKNYDVEQKGHYSAGKMSHPKARKTTKKRQPAKIPIEIPEDSSD